MLLTWFGRWVLRLVLLSMGVFVLGNSIVAQAQRYRTEDQLLFPHTFQSRIVQPFELSDTQHAAFSNWEERINSILALPKKDRPTELDLHEEFFSKVFVEGLGYQKEGQSPHWTIVSEFHTDVDITRPDGVLGSFNGLRADKDVVAVIELKGPAVDLDLRQNRRQDRRTPVDQAFSYAHKFDDIDWVIVSNYTELRLYNKRSSKYALHFDLTDITSNEEQLKLLVLLLSKDQLLGGQSNAIYTQREEELTQITNAFYQDYTDVRLETASAILKADDKLSADQAVFYAQIILDRLIFMMFLEDLGLIPRETIEEAYKTRNPYSPTAVWGNFQGLFRAMDKGSAALQIPAYAGGLFRFDEQVDTLPLSDDLFEGYKKLADYDFLSDLRVNILGHVFERSITDTDSLKAHLRGEESFDTRRHDEGAFYTPEAVTQYIIETTLHARLSDIRRELGFEALPDIREADLSDFTSATRDAHLSFWMQYALKVQSLKIVDPSVGSGAFLVSAFDILVDEKQRINKELLNLNSEPLFHHVEEDTLQHNLYGVDLSPEAVNITRISLWLKVAHKQQPLVRLEHTIRAGNAVTDFDWHKAFPEVFAQGGFDLVVGNPPYVRQQLIGDLKPVLKERFETYHGRADLYVYFHELGYDILKTDGRFGFISSNKWMKANYGKKMRGFFKDKSMITHLLDLTGRRIFKDARVDTNILMFKKASPTATNQITFEVKPFFEAPNSIQQSRLTEEVYILKGESFFQLKEQMERVGTPLKDWGVEINRGVTTGFNEAFIIDEATKDALIAQDPKSAEILKPMLRGRDIDAWTYEHAGLWLIFTRRGVDIERYPAIKSHLMQYYDRLKPRNNGEKTGRSYRWYELNSGSSHGYEQDKIIYGRINHSSAFMVDRKQFHHNDTVGHISGLDAATLFYIVGVLNSDVAFAYFLQHGSALGEGTIEFRNGLVQEFPLPKVLRKDQQQIIQLSKDLHELSKDHVKNATEVAEKTKLLNGLVQKLYGLTDEHRKALMERP